MDEEKQEKHKAITSTPHPSATESEGDLFQWVQQFVDLKFPLSNWMAGIPDHTHLYSVTIPGTHNSSAVSSNPIVACQSMSVEGQLNAGIRYLDFRCSLENNGVLTMRHGVWSLGTTLEGELKKVYDFLELHSGECVIAEISRESSSSKEFGDAVARLIDQHPGYWYVNGDTNQTLGSLRKKIVLLRRYPSASRFNGVDVTAWKDNSPDFSITTRNPDASLQVQDAYNFERQSLSLALPIKFNLITSFTRTVALNPRSLCISFTSASSFPSGTPLQFATRSGSGTERGINVQLLDYLTQNVGDNFVRFGVFVMDFPDDNLIFKIICCNELV